jgi:2-oxoglutarate ferredoxin oxidoreductase subunit gamma
MTQETLIAGFGGQGILLMGQLLAQAAMRQGYHATWFPSYGPEMRGGTANCLTVYSDDEIGSPIVSLYGAVVAMNGPSLEKFAPRVRRGGTAVINETMVHVRCQRHDVTLIYVPAGEIASELGDKNMSNVVMLGALVSTQQHLKSESVEQAIRELIGQKNQEMVADNLEALQRGREHAAALTT